MSISDSARQNNAMEIIKEAEGEFRNGRVIESIGKLQDLLKALLERGDNNASVAVLHRIGVIMAVYAEVQNDYGKPLALVSYDNERIAAIVALFYRFYAGQWTAKVCAYPLFKVGVAKAKRSITSQLDLSVDWPPGNHQSASLQEAAEEAFHRGVLFEAVRLWKQSAVADPEALRAHYMAGVVYDQLRRLFVDAPAVGNGLRVSFANAAGRHFSDVLDKVNDADACFHIGSFFMEMATGLRQERNVRVMARFVRGDSAIDFHVLDKETEQCLQKGERALRKALSLRPNFMQAYDLLLDSLPRDRGDVIESVWREKIFTQEALCSNDYLSESRLRIFEVKYLHKFIGPYTAFDLYLKARSLGLVEPYKVVVLTDGSPANQTLLDYFKEFGDALVIEQNPQRISKLRPLVDTFGAFGCLSKEADEVAFISRDTNRALSFSPAKVLRRWETERTAPLVTLKADHKERGWRALVERGISQSDWFVALHVRDSGFAAESDLSFNRHRNADVMTYLPAIRSVVEGAGKVIRLGDASVTSLPEMDGVWDYAKSDFRSDWMDVFLWSECRFFLCCSSGPAQTVSAFDKPRLIVNTNLVDSVHLSCDRDMILPKLITRGIGGSAISFPEMVAKELRHYEITPEFWANELFFVDNTEDEIEAATREMVARVDGSYVEDAETAELRRRFNRSIADLTGHGYEQHISGAFLRKHRYLIPDA